MDRKEMIDAIVKCYFEGGNWRMKLKGLVKEEKRNETSSNGSNSLRIDINHHTDCI